MILDTIAKTFLALAGITSNLKQPSAAVLSYVKDTRNVTLG